VGFGPSTKAEGAAALELLLGRGQADVDHPLAAVLVERTEGQAAGDVDVVFSGADAKIVGVIEDTESPVEPVALFPVDADTAVAAGREGLHRQRTFDKGEVLGAGLLLEAEVLLVVAESNLAPILQKADVDILEIGVAASEVVLRLEPDAFVDRALKEQSCAAELETVFEARERVVLRHEGVVALDPAPELQFEGIVGRAQREAVRPLQHPVILRPRGRREGKQSQQQRGTHSGGVMHNPTVHSLSSAIGGLRGGLADREGMPCPAQAHERGEPSRSV
jgi:hypothetical protein